MSKSRPSKRIPERHLDQLMRDHYSYEELMADICMRDGVPCDLCKAAEERENKRLAKEILASVASFDPIKYMKARVSGKLDLE